MEMRGTVVDAYVARQAVGLVNGHVKLVVFGIVDLQVLTFHALQVKLYQAAEESNAVLDVDDVIARLHIGEEALGWTT
jgi:hypothetical protein